MSMQAIPINDLKRLHAAYADRMNGVAERVLASGWWLNGARNAEFCAAFAGYVGAKHCIGVANGTDALEIAIRALLIHGAVKGDEVVTVANAGGYASTACFQIGLTPVYVDVERESQLVALDQVVAALGERTALVIVTHLYGGVVDVPRLRTLMDEAGYRHVPILEDCAQAHGVAHQDRMAGAMGDIATFSFYPTKNLGAFGDAGAVVTSDDGLAELVRRLQQYGWASKYTIATRGGRNSRLDELQAAFLSELLPDLDAANARRRIILDRYEQAAPEGMTVVRSPLGTVAHLAVILCDGRDELRAHLAERGVSTDVHYPILDCDQPGWTTASFRIAPDGLETARDSLGRLLTLPCFPTMTDGEVERVCGALAEWRR